MSLEINQRRKNKYLLLAEFSVRTVNYGPSFFASIYGPSASRLGHKSMGKNDGFFLFRGPETSVGRTI